MLIYLFLAGVLTAFGLALIFRARQKQSLKPVRAVGNTATLPPQRARSAPQLYAVVNQDQAVIEPYPYVLIELDGTARELHASEREYLETSFEPFDSARPYVKTEYEDKNGWGDLSGFLERARVPSLIPVQPPPVQNPTGPMTRESVKQFMLEKGLNVMECADGTLQVRKPKPASKPKD